jgi:magnesium transporter
VTDLDTRWVDLVDPTEAELRTQLPEHIHATARAALLAPHVHDDEPRPRIESHGDYILGIFLLPVVVADEDRVFYQEIDMIATTRQLVSISKTPPGEQPFDPQPAKEACRTHEDVGMFVYHLVDTIAERYLDLVDSLDDEIDDLEDLIVDHPVRVVAIRLRELRHDVRGIRRTLAPTRDAVHKIVDNRVELDEGELFPRDVEIAFGDAYDKLLRASEGLESWGPPRAGGRR